MLVLWLADILILKLFLWFFFAIQIITQIQNKKENKIQRKKEKKNEIKKKN